MPMSALLNIAIAEPSAIIRSGLEAVLKRIPGFRIQIIEIATAELLQETLRSHKPDILIINPSLPGYYTIQLLKEETGCTEMKCIALLYAVADHALLRPYDDQINIYDSPDEIRHKLERLHTSPEEETENEEQQTLSAREKRNRGLCRQRDDKPRNSRPPVPFHTHRCYTPTQHRPEIAGTQCQWSDRIRHC